MSKGTNWADLAPEAKPNTDSLLVLGRAIVLVVLFFAPSAFLTGCAGVVSGAGPSSGNSKSPATFTVNPTSMDFGTVATGNKVPQQATVRNTGTGPINVTSLTVTGSAFSVSGVTVPLSLGVGQGANFSVWFNSGTAGQSSGTLTAQADGGASPAVVNLSGTGVAPSLNLSATPSAISFGSVKAGTTTTQNLTVSNTGNANVTISQINVSAKDVAVSGVSLPATLTPTQSLGMTVQFKPLAAEVAYGNITFLDALGASLTVGVTGSGVQGTLTTTPTSVAFGSVVNGDSNSQSVRINNTGNSSVTISQANVTGSGFSISGLALPVVIMAGQSSNFNLVFTPGAVGSVTGSITLQSDASNSTDTLALSGTGVTAVRTLSVSPSSLNFGSVNVGSISSQALTLTNTGNSNVTISQITASAGPFSMTGAAAPLVLSPSQTTIITVNFNPTVVGTSSGSVAVVSDANGSPASIALSGSGALPSTHTVLLSWDASTSAVSGYFLYRSTTNGSGYSKLNPSFVPSLTFTDATLQSNQTYYYVATAVDANGIESGYSNQVQVVIP
ncbi:MAG: hypothetical protein PVS2B2_22610 [Candidatus Acidiferrum sp.]